MPLSKCHFQNAEFDINTLTQEQFKILFLCYKNGGKIDFNHQERVYRNQRSFFNSMLDLIRQKAMRELNLHEYELTNAGKFYVQKIILR